VPHCKLPGKLDLACAIDLNTYKFKVKNDPSVTVTKKKPCRVSVVTQSGLNNFIPNTR
jgi:hypothetical protein